VKIVWFLQAAGGYHGIPEAANDGLCPMNDISLHRDMTN